MDLKSLLVLLLHLTDVIGCEVTVSELFMSRRRKIIYGAGYIYFDNVRVSEVIVGDFLLAD